MPLRRADRPYPSFSVREHHERLIRKLLRQLGRAAQGELLVVLELDVLEHQTITLLPAGAKSMRFISSISHVAITWHRWPSRNT